MKKRIVSILIAAVMLVSILPVFTFAAGSDFAGGSGTENDPYLISNKTHLSNVRYHLDAYFKMINDIEFSDSNFSPIGALAESAFEGVFDGNGYTIKNIYVYVSTNDRTASAGVFGYVGGIVKNLRIEGGTVTARALNDEYSGTAGGIVGCLQADGTIQNCFNSATVWGDSYAGGIIGMGGDSLTEGCVNEGKISSGYGAGGIVGLSFNGTVTSSCNRGAVASKLYAGGIAGSSTGKVTECYNTGNISASWLTDEGYPESWAGGIVGNNLNIVADCYNTGKITAFCEYGGASAGGIAGISSYDTVDRCYNIGTAFAASNAEDDRNNGLELIYCGAIAGTHFTFPESDSYYLNTMPQGYGHDDWDAVKCTEEQLQKQATFAGFDFENVWTMSGSSIYPFPELKTVPMEGFIDVAVDAWYRQYVDYSADNGIFGGTGGGKFQPESNITRAEFVQVLANISGVDTSNKKVSTKFYDVKSGQWFAPAVRWASDNGIVAGKSATSFDPNAKITREEMCVMLINYAKFRGITLKNVESKSVFADDSKISSWAKERVYMCQTANLINGKGANKFDPQGNANRAEAATIFTLFYKEYLK